MKEKVLITGSSSGIGETIAMVLSHKYDIVLNGRDLERLQSVKNNLAKGNHTIWHFDLAETGSLEDSLKKFLDSQKISITHLVHSAGVMNLTPLKILSFESFEKTLRINLMSAALIIKILANKKLNPTLKSAVFISSIISNFGAKAMSEYSASKSGLDGLMRSLAVELAPRIRVNSILPGSLKTRMTESIYQNDEVVNRMDSNVPLGSGELLDIAHSVEFLISSNAKWITGQQLAVDGGRVANISG